MKIVLIGFMGSGKTSVAKLLADKLKINSIEMDDLILKISGKQSINEIFHKEGEKRFREIESQVAKDLMNENNVVVSSGGGVVMDKTTMEYLAKDAQIVYLKVSFEIASQRVKQKQVIPPLFEDTNTAHKLFTLREPLYNLFADIVIDTDKLGINDVVDKIVVELNQKGRDGW